MGKFWAEMNKTTGVATSYTLMADRNGTYTPPVDGRLKKLRLVVAGDAVTSLIEAVACKVTCPTFGGVECEIATPGGQIRTAPAVPIPVAEVDCDLKVKSANVISCYYKHITGATPVTPRITLYGQFEA